MSAHGINSEEKAAVPVQGEGHSQEHEDLTSTSSSNLLKVVQGGFFLAVCTTACGAFGFGATLTSARKEDVKSGKAMSHQELMAEARNMEDGHKLAARALRRATVYAVTGVGLFTFIVWKLSGAHSMKEFKQKVRGVVPQPAREKGEGRSEFNSLKDFVDYLVAEDTKKAREKDDKT